MNEITWLSLDGGHVVGGLTVARASCNRHWRFLDATGLCPSCQREAVEQAQERSRAEEARQIAVAEECDDRAGMYGL